MLCVTGIPDAATRNVEETAQEDEFGAKDYRSTLELKKDHNSRPLWVVGCLLEEKCCVFFVLKYIVFMYYVSPLEGSGDILFIPLRLSVRHKIVSAL